MRRPEWYLRATQLLQALPPPYWYLWLGTLLNKIGWLVVPFLTLYLAGVQHLSIRQATLAVALVGLGSVVSWPVGGLFADHVGRRRTLLLALSLTAATTLALGLVRGLWPITLLAFLVGGFSTLYGPAASALIADLVEQGARARAYRLQYWATNVGLALAPLLAGIVTSRSYLALFAIDALTTALFGVLVWRRVPETRPHPIDRSTKRVLSPDRAGGRGAPFLLVLTLLAFGFACIWFQGYVALPLDMRAHGLNNIQYGIAIAMNGLVVITLSMPLGTLLERFPRRYVLAGATLTLGIGFGLTALVSSLPLYALTVVIWTLGEVAAVPLATSMVADLAPAHRRGFFQGVYGTAWGLASFVGPALSGLLIEQVGTRALWLGCFLLASLLALTSLVLVRLTERQRAKHVIST